MLVLSRKEGEEIVITATNGEVIRVVVHEQRGDNIRLGFVAPPMVLIDRAEVHERRKQGG
jgi:carbon storage regulator CsrA